MSATRCDLCGYKFKTTQKLVRGINTDREKYEEYVAYPDPTDPNPAHLVKNYVCDNCYQNIGNIIRNNLIKEGKKFVEKLPSRIEEKKKELEEESKEVEEICKKLNSINHLFELSSEEVKLINKHAYKPFRNYYLDSAIKIEREMEETQR